MSTTHTPPAQAISLAQPPCPKCKTPMWLARIEHHSKDHDQRTFECPRCQETETMVVRYRR